MVFTQKLPTFAPQNKTLHLPNGKNEVDSLAQQVEHIPFKDGVLGSSPKRITEKKEIQTNLFSFLYIRPLYFFQLPSYFLSDSCLYIIGKEYLCTRYLSYD